MIIGRKVKNAHKILSRSFGELLRKGRSRQDLVDLQESLGTWFLLFKMSKYVYSFSDILKKDIQHFFLRSLNIRCLGEDYKTDML
jgi:hypothetical protein